MFKKALALAALSVCTSSFSAELLTTCPTAGNESVAGLHHDWVMIGWERDAGDPDFNFRKDVGKYYDLTSTDL